jgi:hypothetical protein
MHIREKILVRGVKYPKDDKRAPAHGAIAGGPLVNIPGTVVPLSNGGDGGIYAASAQQYIGWRRERMEEPILVDGEPILTVDRKRDGLQFAHVQFRWVFDPSPVLVPKTPEIMRAIARGDIELATPEKKKKSGGGD